MNGALCMRTMRAWYVPLEALRAAVNRVKNMACDVQARSLVTDKMVMRRADGENLEEGVENKIYEGKFSVLIKFKISWHQYPVQEQVQERSPSPPAASASDPPA